MDAENSEDFEIKFQAEGEERDLTKKESIDLLKSKGIIHISTKKQEINIEKTDDGKIIHSGEDAKIFADALKRIGNIKDDDILSSTWTLKNTCFKLSPRVKIFDLNNQQVGFNATILDNEINFNDGFIELCQSDDKQTQDSILEFFNKLISIFNILNIPFDFVHDYELIRLADINFENGTHKEDVYVVCSQKARSRGKGYKAIKLNTNDLFDLIMAVNLVWSSIKNNDILKTGDVFIFLGYGKYYHFHGDYLLSFANTWMFVEAVLNLTWEKMMRNNGFSNKYLKTISRNWTSQIKIDALQLQGIIDKETCIKAQDMRNRRNSLFHVSKEENKRKIDKKISEDCIDLGLSLFYQNLDLIDLGYVVSFDDIASYVNNSIHEPQKI
ncbi:hypothetical protein [Methanosarcina sp.]|uniref:hypothetical protein n=1 Tax=Methanosarcina sp. TaxID=2213 RepID=UPI003C72CFB1